ncbi:class I adenylate cyclase [Vibrio lentus]|nr:class I adenylate cyclase [Vibrio lentus]
MARKLYAAFEVLPGKVTLLNPQIFRISYEPDLSFIEVRQGQANKPGWYLYKQPLIAHRILGQPSLEHHEYLSKLVAWSFLMFDYRNRRVCTLWFAMLILISISSIKW